MTLMEALRQEGLGHNPADLSTSSIKPEHIKGYATLHDQLGHHSILREGASGFVGLLMVIDLGDRR